MRSFRDRFISGPPLLFSLLLGVVWATDVSALQTAEVVIDGRVEVAVEVAQTAQEQARGLAGRSSLEKGRGMVFPFDVAGPRAFWMEGMLIPLDILWIRDGRIAAIEANVAPPRSRGAPALFSHVADLVLEVPAGFALEMGIRVGESVRIRYESGGH